MDDTSLSKLLEELMDREHKRSKKHTSGEASSGDHIEFLATQLEQVSKLKNLYKVLKEVVEPQPCPFWDQGKCRLGLAKNFRCIYTKPYEQVIEVLREAGLRSVEIRDLLGRFQRLGLISVCEPVVRRDRETTATGALLGALLGVVAGGGLNGALFLGVIGGIVGWFLGGEKRYEKRMVFTE